MRRTTAIGPRILAVVEIWAYAVWLGGLVGFALIFAPIAFHTVSDLPLFATLTARNLGALTTVGYVCGGIAIVCALLRSANAAERAPDFARAGLVVAMLVLVAFQAQAIQPRMERATRDATLPKDDPRHIAYDGLHKQSTYVVGGAVLIGFIVLALAAVRPLE